MQHRDRLITVRKLAALDMVFHGSRNILLEFAIGLVITGLLGAWLIYRELAPGSVQSIGNVILGAALLGIGLNYLPLLLYAIQISRQKRPEQVVAAEIAHPEVYRQMYAVQSVFFILIPFALLSLAVIQKIKQAQD